MFNDPLLHRLELLYRASSAPKRWLRTGRYAKFHTNIQAGLRITDKKKLKEAIHLVLFALNYSGFPDGSLSVGEEPDFRVRVGSRVVGIEHTRLFIQRPGKPPLKGQEAVQERVVERAHRLYQELRRPPVMISCSFGDDTRFRNRDVDDLSKRLAENVPESLSVEQEWTLCQSHECGEARIPGLMCIQGRRPQPYEPQEGRWHVSQGGSIYSCEPSIQAALDAKESKITRYSECDEIWGLWVVEGLSASSFLRKPAVGHVFATSFNRVFVYHLLESITEVRCDNGE